MAHSFKGNIIGDITTDRKQEKEYRIEPGQHRSEEALLHFSQVSEELLFPKLTDCVTILNPAELPVRKLDAV